MKLKQSIRYQLADFIGPVIIYYGIVLALYALYYAACVFAWANMNFSGGLSSCTAIFLFICGLCSFHDNLPMHLQNGVSRKTMYTAWLVVTVIVSASMALLDALLATVQMPSGIPVATVALNGAKNAAWLAAEILALSDDALAAKLAAERAAMAEQIAAKEEKLQKEIEEL